MRIERTHDKFYLKDVYKDEPKEYFKLVRAEIGNTYFSDNEFSLLDIGCASGGFLYYLRKEFPEANLTGMDVMEELLPLVNDGIEGKQIITHFGDIASRETLPNSQYDVITMLGVLSIFDEFEKVLNNAVSMLNKKGVLMVFGIFNPEEVDVLIKSRKAGKKEDVWESGWNYFSKNSIENYCGENNLNFEWIPFQIHLDIPKHKDDPLRSWTIDLPGEEKMIVNGLQLVHHFYLLKITRKQKN